MIMQMEATECGAASLAMVLAYYGRWITLEEARESCGVSRDGSKASNILKAARAYGMEADPYRCTVDGVRDVDEFPSIIFWNFNHFVVLRGFKGKHAYLNDPARGAVKVDMEEFDRSFTGIVLRMKPTGAFRKGGAPKSVLGFAKERLKGMGTALAFIALCCAVIALVSIISTSTSTVYLDHVLSGESPSWLAPILAIMAAAVLIQAITILTRTFSINRVRGKFATVGSARFMWHLLHLPVVFYEQRSIGDLQQRQKSNETVAATLLEQLAPAVINVALLLVYLGLMLAYSWKLALVAIAAVALNAISLYATTKLYTNMSRQMARTASNYYGVTMAGVEAIDSIKAAGAERGYFERWAGEEAALNDVDVKFTKATVYFGAIPQFIAQIGNIGILLLGAYLIIVGELTAGMLLAFQGFFTSFISPVNQIMQLGQQFQTMRVDMERIDDVLEYPSDTNEGKSDTEMIGGKLSGAIELEHVTFGYSQLEAPLIKDFSLTVEPGQWIALVGASGSGKSTIAKILSGLYEPWSGEVRFDGIPLRQVEAERLRGSLSVVDQDITMFVDSIGANNRLWNHSIEDFEVILAARDADIHDEILSREKGYDSHMAQGGKNFSGGQLQRLEIARALASDPTIIVLDEATSALDAETEENVIRAVRRRGITCVVVAHRLSTIRDCDEILVLQDGVVAERGTHDELMAMSGAYAMLVRST